MYSNQKSRQWFHALMERFYDYNRENYRGMNLLEYIAAHENDEDFELHLVRAIGYFETEDNAATGKPESE